MVKKRMQQAHTPTPKRKKGKRAHAFKPVGDSSWWAASFKEAGVSQNSAAEQLRLGVGGFSKVFGGRQRMAIEKWIHLALLLKIPLTTALRRGGYEIPELRIPVEGHILMNARVSYGVHGETVAANSDDPAVKAFVFNVVSGPLVGFNGMALHYKPSNTIEAESFGQTSVIQVEGEPTPVVGTIHRKSGGKLKITLLNGEIIENKRVVFAAPAERIVKP